MKYQKVTKDGLETWAPLIDIDSFVARGFEVVGEPVENPEIVKAPESRDIDIKPEDMEASNYSAPVPLVSTEKPLTGEIVAGTGIDKEAPKKASKK